MKKQLRKPENWQDFESLCKTLWGEIWECKEIKKNGRYGQGQQGVDVYGIPIGENQYYGIQCKGKDDYIKSKLSKSEVDEEIKKALLFKPTLKKFYFATTANKDSKIEEYIRIKDIESRANGAFEIHLFSWEDIVDLIDENKHTHDWYVSNIGYKIKHSIKIQFGNENSDISFKPILVRNHIAYKQKNTFSNNSISLLPPIQFNDNDKFELEKLTSPQPKKYYINGQTNNLSSCIFNIYICNDGNIPLDDYKIYFTFPKEVIAVEIVDKSRRFLDSFIYNYNTYFDRESGSFIFYPQEKTLVQKDRVFTDYFCLRPMTETTQKIILDYEFIAKDFHKTGQLSINIEPTVKDVFTEIESIVLSPNETRLENYFE